MFVSAPNNIRNISRDVALVGRVLRQLRTILGPSTQPDSDVNLSAEALKLTVQCIEGCEAVFREVREVWGILGKILGKPQTRDPENKITISRRLFYMFYDGDLSKKREDLKYAKQNVVLINSVNQIALSRHSIG